MGFRHPRLDKKELDLLYSCGSPLNWQYEPKARSDWALAARVIRENIFHDAAILDVGCFDGAFLATLPGIRRKAGIEILPEAAARARDRGVEIVGSDFESLSEARARYDVVTAFDIIEHVENPLDFMRLLTQALKPGGMLLVSTGNLDAWSWRIMRNFYWYSAIPEHISFLSERWFHYASSALGLEAPRIHRYAHVEEPLPRRLAEVASNMTFLIAPRLIGLLRRSRPGTGPSRLDPSIVDEYPPRWMTARDHILVALTTGA